MEKSTKAFDAGRYARAYPDVALSGLDPKTHYERYGRLLGRDPAPQSSRAVPATATNNREAIPALLDLQYARGVIPNGTPIRHEDLVTIILPSYNNEEWIARAIHSALSQQGVRIELLVVDDGSTDGSVSVARRIAADHPNMRVMSLLRNFGCYYARNIGVLNARGSWITIIDSDDIMPPDRILRQMDALKANPAAVACLAQLRRWTVDFHQPLSDSRHGENTLLWRHDITEQIGLYDSVRYGGDTEFRTRLKSKYGSNSIVHINDELYFARTVATSLTQATGSQAYSINNDTLQLALSPARELYSVNFTDWRKSSPSQYIEFPQLSRPFDLGSPEQNASPSLDQKRVGAMASFPPRRESLEHCLETILPQLDELILYLNNYDSVPNFALHPKIRAVLSRDRKGDLRDNGKFYDLPQDDDTYIFTFDDDITYPSDYTSRMIHFIEMLGRDSVVGLHGVIFPDGEFERLQQRTVHHFREKRSGSFVDLLGTGTTAWHSSALKLNLDDFPTAGVADLWFAVATAKRGIPLFSVPRSKDWLTERQLFSESLYQEALSQPKAYFDVFNNALAPILQKGLVRRRTEAHLARGFDADTLNAAGIKLNDNSTKTSEARLLLRRPLIFRKPPNQTDAVASAVEENFHFHIVVNGYNCHGHVDTCLRSIACQKMGPYSYDITLIDDGSDDGTYEKLAASTILPQARLIRIKENTGPAYARHTGISMVDLPDTIIVLVDMDDALEPNALATVTERYRKNPACLMTIGNWIDQDGDMNPQAFYSPDELNHQKTREVKMFNATHLRTFRRKLYDAIRPEDLLGPDGKWLETCTDVALMYPLLDQCWANEVEFIHEPIYRYNRMHSGGTLARFGKPHKVERLAWLKSKPPKPRLNPARRQMAAG